MAAGVGYLDGQTPGSEADALEAVRMILDLGADINAGSECGHDALADASPYRGLCCGWDAAARRGVAGRRFHHPVARRARGAARRAGCPRGEPRWILAEGHVLYISVYIRESSARLLRELMREQRVER